MEIRKQAIAGTLQSNDCQVRIVPGEDGILISPLRVRVMETFGKQIEKVIRETLVRLNVEHCRILVEDRGALDYTIRARVETAVRRAYE